MSKLNNLNRSISVAILRKNAFHSLLGYLDRKPLTHSTDNLCESLANYKSNSTYYYKWQINLPRISTKQISAHNFYTNKCVSAESKFLAWSMDHCRIFHKTKSLTKSVVHFVGFIRYIQVFDTTLNITISRMCHSSGS